MCSCFQLHSLTRGLAYDPTAPCRIVRTVRPYLMPMAWEEPGPDPIDRPDFDQSRL